MTDSKRVLALFDVDGTLTVPRNEIKADMIEELKKLRSKIKIGIVGGSDMSKQYEQLGKTVLEDFDYVFTENGLVAYKNGDLLAKQSFSKHLGEEKLKQVINFCLRYMADIEDIPVKRGTFIEFRAGMINVSPVGRNCSQEERDAFEQHDLKTGIRKRFVSALKERFPDLDLVYSIGGQISFDMFPKGWDKTYCLQFVKPEFDEIHFFGDKTFEGGNDFEIYTSPDTVGHCVNGPDDTIKQVRETFGI